MKSLNSFLVNFILNVKFNCLGFGTLFFHRAAMWPPLKPESAARIVQWKENLICHYLKHKYIPEPRANTLCVHCNIAWHDRRDTRQQSRIKQLKCGISDTATYIEIQYRALKLRAFWVLTVGSKVHAQWRDIQFNMVQKIVCGFKMNKHLSFQYIFLWRAAWEKN